jgi:hypothetical protein
VLCQENEIIFVRFQINNFVTWGLDLLHGFIFLKVRLNAFFLENQNTLTYFSPAFVSQKTNGVLIYVFTV